MLSAESSRLAHVWQNVQLLLLSLFFIPLDTTILFWCYVSQVFFVFEQTAHRRHVRSTRTPYFKPRRILVTGVGMTKGLSLARLFHAAGHDVVGADFEPTLLPLTCGHLSKSVKTFHKLSKPDGTSVASSRYSQSILDIVRKERIDIWVSCSGVASAVEDGQAKEMIELVTNCKAVQFDVETTKKLHEKHSFVEYTKSLGLTVPETHTITSEAAVLKLLDDARTSGMRYIMKFIGTDDSVRGDMTTLPLATPSKTKAHIARLGISADRPWVLQQFISGPEYCTHSLVVNGIVKAFVACPSAELLMHYEALPADAALSQSMLRFTKDFTATSGDGFTGHLSFDFLVDAKEVAIADAKGAESVTLYPIECNPRAHTAVALFRDTPEMIDGYMSLLDGPRITESQVYAAKQAILNGTQDTPTYPRSPSKYYWIGHDIVELVLLPIMSLLTMGDTSLSKVLSSLSIFLEHLILWRDGTFEVWDPLPAWWLYHVYWPYQFLVALLGGEKWSRVNVSTCKMFGC